MRGKYFGITDTKVLTCFEETVRKCEKIRKWGEKERKVLWK